MNDSLAHTQLGSLPEFDELYHYGTKGMKWGRRKGSTTTHKPSVDRRAVDKLREKPVHALSNKQVKTANTRLEMEKKYRELTRQPSAIDKITKGNNSVKAVLAVAGTGIAVYNIANHDATKKGAAFLANLIKKAAASSAARNTASSVLQIAS